MSTPTQTIQGIVKYQNASIYIRIDQSGRNVGILVIDESGTPHNYTISPYRVGQVVMLGSDG